MGKNYVTIPMGYSWERITSFTPWVTHGIEYVLSLNVKCPKVGTLCNLLQGKIYVICLKWNIPAIHQRIDHEFHLDSTTSH